ncbi:MAG: glycoside hydrolase family 3 protein [Erysipelotrichaceae bacterium]|nr:glycoside hydrolase family 3 protein [Erysipelotrichaceae bacterium]
MAVDLRGKPFYLDDKGVEWVEKTFASLSDREKVGQLFCEILWDRPGSEPEDLLTFIEPGAVMYRPFPGHKMWEFTRRIQQNAKVPLLIACNLERGGKGGNGGLIDGTYVASPMGAAATNDPHYAHELARVACEEGGACGVNWTFEPIIDIDRNPENPITNVRTFGSDIEKILSNAKAYIDACRENDFVTSIKHFPGDGVDYRDQHLMSSINSLSAEEWLNTYGYLYKSLIDYGAPTVMSAHIRQPALARMVNPDIKDEDILPGSLSKELMTGILREKFGFNGLIITDATQMVGFTCSMERRKAVPHCIEAGSDMFLFTVNQKEDVEYMLEGLKDGLLSKERLDEACLRVLALKAMIHLDRKPAVPEESGLSVLNNEDHQKVAKEVADKAITLVKDKEGLFPLSPEKTKKISLIQITNERLPESGILPELAYFKEKMEKEGFEVSYFKDGKYPGVDCSIEEFKKTIDLVIYFANMKVGSNQTTIRITWDDFLGESSPKYVHDLPYLFLSFSNPYHLVDVPMVKNYINAYTCNEDHVDAMVEKLMGRSEFKGVSPVNPFAGLWDTKL